MISQCNYSCDVLGRLSRCGLGAAFDILVLRTYTGVRRSKARVGKSTMLLECDIFAWQTDASRGRLGACSARVLRVGPPTWMGWTAHYVDGNPRRNWTIRAVPPHCQMTGSADWAYILHSYVLSLVLAQGQAPLSLPVAVCMGWVFF